MRSGYMPGRKSEQVVWAANLVSVVGPAALDYGVPIPMMTAFTTANTALQAAWAAAQAPASRTRGAVATADGALKTMREKASPIVATIQAAPNISPEMLIAAGLTVRKTRPTPSPLPQTSPYIKVRSVNGRTVTLELQQDSATRGKPARVATATLLTATGEQPPLSVDDWSFLLVTGKTLLTIPFPPSDTATTLHLTAFWTNTAKETGPAAVPTVINLPAGGTMPVTGATSMKIAA